MAARGCDADEVGRVMDSLGDALDRLVEIVNSATSYPRWLSVGSLNNMVEIRMTAEQWTALNKAIFDAREVLADEG